MGHSTRRTAAFVLGAAAFMVACGDGAGNDGGTTQAGSTAGGTRMSRALVAEPNPIQVCDGSKLGITTLYNRSSTPGALDMRVGSNSGKLFATLGRGGSAVTGKWVTDGMQFFLVNGSETLDTVTIKLTQVGCK